MLPRLPYAGAVDADGYVLEPPDLWDRELEAPFRDRPMGIRRDGEGREYLEVAGRPSKMVRNNLPQALGAMDLIGGIPAPAGRARTGLGYLDNAGLGAWDATERLARLDHENLDVAVLYPTLGVLWEAECEDLELAQAYTRAYNRWIVEFCRGAADASCRSHISRSACPRRQSASSRAWHTTARRACSSRRS